MLSFEYFFLITTIRNLKCSRNIDPVWYKKLWIKTWYNSKNISEYCLFFLCNFLGTNCADTYRTSLYQNVIFVLAIRIMEISELFGIENYAED